MSIEFLIDLVVILLSTELLGAVTKRLKMPRVVGALIAGLLIGPSFLNLVKPNDFLTQMAKIGVILLMFNAGVDSDLKELKKSGKASTIVALIGVFLPLIGGFLVAGFFNNAGTPFSGGMTTTLQNIFIGVILTATSVSITVETLQEMGKLKTHSGTTILGAAVIDDILGIVLLAIITGMSNPQSSIRIVIIKIVAFFAVSVLLGMLFKKGFSDLKYISFDTKRVIIYALVFCFIMSFNAEHFFGVADITGAYVAGVILSLTKDHNYIKESVETISTAIFSPIFFANIGITTVIYKMNTSMIIFTILLLLVAILTKLYGCKFGAEICGFGKEEGLQIGVGMISRGEVALIVTDIGVASGFIKDIYLAPVIIVVIVTTIITPILLKLVYSHKNEEVEEFQKQSVPVQAKPVRAEVKKIEDINRSNK
ncbi:Na(+)/H(+)-K(+) antiporter GerN [Clostridium acetireducens DSM 10703]|uniref:Na(+)/H(+)-K(+) antiporter GerN n=1 Tax=Clostridium acetireducens DSM 10703 TaxID=1121290 RepID=A0A1E8EW45_9CLOT|nr:cation:proton antiporter [Clostridium acetireducens]OFI01479.1 Na(+)/H(+)-K(+) antiporter GerN [Clostridium acetireducens DSM 10703]